MNHPHILPLFDSGEAELVPVLSRANRITNLVVAALFVPFTVFNVAGGFYLYFYGLGVALELVVLALIVRYAWTWPRTAPSATLASMATSPDREPLRAHQR